MKKTFTLILSLFTIIAIAQVPDFTVTDIEGVDHNLYSYLDDGKVVVLDVSATWCSNCWNFHQGKFLEAITEKYGPDGTDQVQVLFYEGDANTSLAQLQGMGGTQGDWIAGTNYPIINESPISIDMSVFSSGFPTVSVIRPADKLIIADLNDNFKNGGGLAAMEEIIEGAIPETSSTSDLVDLDVSVYPNPFVNEIIIDLRDVDFNFTSIQILDIRGSIVQSKEDNVPGLVRIQTEELTNGMYFINILNNNEVIGSRKITK